MANRSFRVRPNPRWFALTKKLNMDFIGVAAHRAVFHILLLGAAGGVEGDDDLFATGGADVAAFIGRSTAFFSAFLFHS